MSSYPHLLSKQQGAISLEMVVTIPIVIYSLIIITGFLQVINNYSLLSYNIANARNKFNYSYIVNDQDYKAVVDEFYNTIVTNINANVINVERDDVKMSCYSSLDDLDSDNKLSSCSDGGLKDIDFFVIDLNYKFSEFSSLFSKYYEKYFIDMSQRVIVVNEYY